MMRPLSAAAVVALLAGPASAQSGVEIGVLTCRVTEVTNLVVYTSQTFDCTFDPANDRPTESYAGEITKIGVDLSIKNDFTIVWGVLAPSQGIYEPGSLAGTYVGAGADVAIGAGVGAQVLAGGGEQSFSLQPVSVSGVEGIGASLGIESFQLSEG